MRGKGAAVANRRRALSAKAGGGRRASRTAGADRQGEATGAHTLTGAVELPNCAWLAVERIVGKK